MRISLMITTFFFTTAFLGACNGQQSSPQTNTDELEENEVVVLVDGEEWSTTNVRLAGRNVFGMRGSSRGTFGITVDVGYGLEEVGTYTKGCEYSRKDREGNSNEWVDDKCTVEITALTDKEIKGTFSFTGISEDSSEKSVSGRFRVEKMVIR